jgi:hypothetical protein
MSKKIEQIPSSEKITDKINRLILEVLDYMDVLEYHKKMAAFAKKIREKYPDYDRHRCYHKLVGSTIPEDVPNIVEEDFEGEDSVAGFLEGLLKEGGK